MTRSARALATAMAALAMTAVAACGGSDDAVEPAVTTPLSTPTSPAPAADPSSVTPPTEVTSVPTSAVSSAPPTDDPSTSIESTTSSSVPVDDSPASRARSAQIPAAALPGFNAEWTWRRDSAGSGPGQDAPSVCMQSSLSAIGAVAEYRTDYSSVMDPLATAHVLSAVFPDEQTAVTSSKVLDSWLRRCRAHASRDLGLEEVRVTTGTVTDTVVGPTRQSLVTYHPVAGEPRSAWFQAEGFVRDGDTLTYVILVTAGQDYNYEPGHQPVDDALAVAAERLVATR